MGTRVIIALSLLLAACGGSPARDVTGTVQEVSLTPAAGGARPVCVVRYTIDGEPSVHVSRHEQYAQTGPYEECSALKAEDRIPVTIGERITSINWRRL